ncbi:MAG: hypothetical protein NC548_27800 [Lachnospiraceae bacterium]|nr:hypothetical protein [Lachnospiraceae bacterium]
MQRSSSFSPLNYERPKLSRQVVRSDPALRMMSRFVRQKTVDPENRKPGQPTSTILDRRPSVQQEVYDAVDKQIASFNVRNASRFKPHFKPMIHESTQNKSFLRVRDQLKMKGIKNNQFFLILLNPLLEHVDPYDPNITPEQAMMVVEECQLNIFYFLREVVRIPEQGGTLVHFRLDRGTLAALYCFYHNQNFYLVKPRQTGKSVGIDAMLAWAFKFGITNGGFMFSGNNEKTAKDNLGRMKGIIANLPSYLAKMGTEKLDTTGKIMRKTNNIKSYKEPVSNNAAVVSRCAINEIVAEEIGRGESHNFEFFDEAEFTNFIEIIVQVSGMAFNTASANAIANGAHSCRIFATTPGDLGDKKKCQSALKIVRTSLPWDERFYDIPPEEFKALAAKGCPYTDENGEYHEGYNVVYIEYDYKQLGLGETWFRNACKNVGGNRSKIRREILLKRFSGVNNSPFTEDQITELEESCRKPVKKITLMTIYDILLYKEPEEISKTRVHIIAVDPSDGMGQGSDNYAVTAIDPYTLETVMEFKSQYMDPHRFVTFMEYITTKFFQKPLIVIENNKNGHSLISFFDGHPLEPYIYATPEANMDTALIRDDLDEKGFIEERLSRRRYKGVNTSPTSRRMMMQILTDTVKFKKQLLNTRYIVDDIKHLVVVNDKIQAEAGEHDDCIMSWCLGMYVYYYGVHLERYGFIKGQLPQDIETSDEYMKLKELYSHPAIQKAFPTIYAFYKEMLEPQMERKHAASTATKMKAFDPLANDMDDRLMAEDPEYRKMKEDQSKGEEWRNQLSERWSRLNKR